MLNRPRRDETQPTVPTQEDHKAFSFIPAGSNKSYCNFNKLMDESPMAVKKLKREGLERIDHLRRRSGFSNKGAH